MSPVLVLGYGSTLRRDDAVGRHVAERVAARNLPGVEARTLHQLTPEVAAELAGRRLVVFIDASAEAEAVTVEHLDARSCATTLSHNLHPAGLLRLAAAFGWAPQQAVAVAVPAADLGLGTTLSPAAATAVDAAVRRVVALCT